MTRRGRELAALAIKPCYGGGACRGGYVGLGPTKSYRPGFSAAAIQQGDSMKTIARRHVCAGAAMAALCLALASAPAFAAELKVTSAGAVRGLIAEIIDDYSHRTGQKFDFTIGTTGHLRTIIASGQHADIIIVSTPLMEELENTGKLMSGSRADLGRVGIGVAIREGAAVPDVTTPDAFKRALIAARTVAYTNPAEGGTSGIYFNGLTERMGIGEAIKQKAVLTRGGREAAIEVAEGRAEMAVIYVSEAIAVKGVKVAGLLPEAVQDYSAYAAAIPASSTDPAAARAFISALASPAMAQRWRANGFDPPK
jgi:molybdate transport system substrate-binding protein